MAQEETEIFEGTVVQTLPDTMFRVELDNGKLVTAHISGRLRKEYIRVLSGDRVLVEMASHDPMHGRITARLLDRRGEAV